jgi:plasmid maintenance system antidote protein VapI
MKSMTPEEILDYLQRLRSVPRLTEVSSAAGVHNRHLHQFMRRERSLTPQMAARLSIPLRAIAQQMRETFSV